MADDALAKELETLKADIGKLRADVADLTRAVKGVAADKVDDANARIHDEIRFMRRFAHTNYSRLGTAANKLISRNKPVDDTPPP